MRHACSAPVLTASLAVLSVAGAAAHAEPFDSIRIGDRDSFGFADIPSLTGVGGGAADRDGNGRLNDGDTLPDINDDGVISGASGDLFDHRTAAEAAGNRVSAVGASDFSATSGSEYTDVAVTDAWSQDPGGNPGFVFDFFVSASDIATDADIFVNFLLADLGRDATVRYTGVDGVAATASLTALTDPGTMNDGYVQESFITLAFGDVFTPEAGGYRGFLEIDLQTGTDPYVAYDYAEIGVDPIPAPASLGALALGALAGSRRRR